MQTYFSSTDKTFKLLMHALKLLNYLFRVFFWMCLYYGSYKGQAACINTSQIKRKTLIIPLLALIMKIKRSLQTSQQSFQVEPSLASGWRAVAEIKLLWLDYPFDWTKLIPILSWENAIWSSVYLLLEHVEYLKSLKLLKKKVRECKARVKWSKMFLLFHFIHLRGRICCFLPHVILMCSQVVTSVLCWDKLFNWVIVCDL